MRAQANVELNKSSFYFDSAVGYSIKVRFLTLRFGARPPRLDLARPCARPGSVADLLPTAGGALHAATGCAGAWPISCRRQEEPCTPRPGARARGRSPADGRRSLASLDRVRGRVADLLRTAGGALHAATGCAGPSILKLGPQLDSATYFTERDRQLG